MDKVTLKRNTPVRSIKYIKQIYQNELDSISKYLTENGLALSAEKSHMVLFNTGYDPNPLPPFQIDGLCLEYKKVVKFLGVNFTSNLNWKYHIQSILIKAKKSINFFKMVSQQTWGKDSKVLIHIATALIRSKLSYAQETFFQPKNIY